MPWPSGDVVFSVNNVFHGTIRRLWLTALRLRAGWTARATGSTGSICRAAGLAVLDVSGWFIDAQLPLPTRTPLSADYGSILTQRRAWTSFVYRYVISIVVHHRIPEPTAVCILVATDRTRTLRCNIHSLPFTTGAPLPHLPLALAKHNSNIAYISLAWRCGHLWRRTARALPTALRYAVL